MKIAICDDEREQLLRISKLVNKYLDSYHAIQKFEVCCFDSSTELFLEIENGKNFDVYLLDVVMPHMNGIELASQIRIKDQIAKIIFLTSSLEFAVESYTVDAFNYLLKPVEEEKLFMALDKILDSFTNYTNDYIVVKTHACLLKVFLSKLIYIEVIKRKIYFGQIDEPIIEVNGTFAEIQDILLKDKRFIKPHRSYLINLDYVISLSTYDFTAINDIVIPVSRNIYKEIQQAYINYSFSENIF